MVQLVQPAVMAVEHQHVAVAVARVRIALDRGIVGNGHGAGIALTAIGGEVDVHEGSAAHNNVRNPDGRSSIQASTEVGMHGSAGTDEVDERVRVGIDGGVGYVLVPRVVGREGNKAVQACAAPQAHAVARVLGIERRTQKRSGQSEEQSKTWHENLRWASGGISKLPQARRADSHESAAGRLVYGLFIVPTETGLILLQHRATSFDLADDQLARVLAIAGWMRGRRNLEALLDQLLGLSGAYRLYAGNRVLVAAGSGWRDSEGVRHLIEIGSNLVPTGGLRIELEIGHELFDLAGGAQHGGDGVTLFGLLELV